MTFNRRFILNNVCLTQQTSDYLLDEMQRTLNKDLTRDEAQMILTTCYHISHNSPVLDYGDLIADGDKPRLSDMPRQYKVFVVRKVDDPSLDRYYELIPDDKGIFYHVSRNPKITFFSELEKIRDAD